MHPYTDLPPRAFWRTGVAESSPFGLADLWQPKFPFQANDAIMTAGSCFAQHIGRALKAAGLNLLDVEPAPPGMSEASANRFGYGLFSARYGNIYTTRQLLQLLDDVVEGKLRAENVWEKNGRFFDALRPGVEPDGLASAADVHLMREVHLARIAKLLTRTDILIFTLGLTEAWQDHATGQVWPICPGVVAGKFDPERHGFVNFTFSDVLADLTEIRARMTEIRPGLRMILTVSPIPLTATASGSHVLAATTYSKAVLRAAAGEFAALHPDVDYFPAYEIVTNPAARGQCFAPNLRNVTPEAVQAVTQSFLSAQGFATTEPQVPTLPGDDPETEDDVVCEERLLEAFRR
jgi:GSCFA family